MEDMHFYAELKEALEHLEKTGCEEYTHLLDEANYRERMLMLRRRKVQEELMKRRNVSE